MTDAKHTTDHQALEHYREQATGEPPAHLDALILAAARNAVPAPKPGLWQRWIRACQQPRWRAGWSRCATLKRPPLLPKRMANWRCCVCVISYRKAGTVA